VSEGRPKLGLCDARKARANLLATSTRDQRRHLSSPAVLNAVMRRDRPRPLRVLHVRVRQTQQQPHGFPPIAFLDLHIGFKDGTASDGNEHAANCRSGCPQGEPESVSVQIAEKGHICRPLKANAPSFPHSFPRSGRKAAFLGLDIRTIREIIVAVTTTVV